MKYEKKEEKVEGGREGKKVVVDGGVTHIGRGAPGRRLPMPMPGAVFSGESPPN